MSLALSQRRTDRHPVGLLVVVGLHVVLAAALLSARLQHPPAREVAMPMHPLDEPVKPPTPRPVDLPPRPLVLPPSTLLVPPEIQTDTPPEAPRGEPEVDHPPPPGVVASADPDRPPASVPHVPARPARLDAGAAQCRPDYPAAAQRAGATGSTRLRFTVDALGRIAGSQILHASGPTREHRLLDQAAAAALSRCPVKVGTDEQGRPVGTTTDVEYVWTLN